MQCRFQRQWHIGSVCVGLYSRLEWSWDWHEWGCRVSAGPITVSHIKDF